MTNAQAAPAVPATSALTLLGPAAGSALQAALTRFQSSVQDWLEAPLDEARVLEWAKLRTAAELGC
ncbi:MAG: hypothetical protein M3217_10075 [Actinomycetota bacterium]|nr:hypothetical protein [Actinomycetota bacterium]